MRSLLVTLACALLLACSTPAEGVPLAKRMFEASQDISAEELEDSVLPQSARRKRKRWGNTALYVDGKFLGMLKFSELHPNLEMRVETLEVDAETIRLRRFVWADLFRAHGIDVDRIRAVHYYGGRSFISIVQGDEFRRVGDTFRFNFTQGDKGKPRQRPPKDGIKYNVGIDIVRAVAVYVDTESPSYKQGKMTFSDGSVLSTVDEKGRIVIPNSDGERHGGTRVYMDGKYIDAFRRRALGPDLLLDKGNVSSPYSFGKSLKQFKIDADSIRRIDLFDHFDKRLASLEGEALSTLDGLGYVLGQHSRGRIQVPDISEERIGAVIIYGTTKPADRSLPKGDGSTPDQPD